MKSLLLIFGWLKCRSSHGVILFWPTHFERTAQFAKERRRQKAARVIAEPR